MIVTQECGSGHESAGEVFEVGPGVTQWKVGDRVAIEAGIPCGQCELCRESISSNPSSFVPLLHPSPPPAFPRMPSIIKTNRR